MRKEYSSYLRKEFDSKVKDALPNFSVVNGEPHTVKGSPLYRHIVEEALSLYVYLAIDGLFNEFTVELAWSTSQCFPQWRPFDDPRPISGDSSRIRLSRLWDTKSDFWWAIEPRDTPSEAIRRVKEFDMSLPPASQFLPNVKTAVQDVIQKLENYGIPYLTQVIIEHGYEAALTKNKSTS
jgi:hypothetical protein